VKKRAWRDARRDYAYEEAVDRMMKAKRMRLGWRLFIALLLSGSLYRFFGG
jgi:hypothetical protein